VNLSFTDAALDALADAAEAVNGAVENIGARRLQTVLEKVVEDISFTAAHRNGDTVVIDADDVKRLVGDLAKNADLSRFIL
jgi:ATP-dependent HslUV protease ATP-binding subunit HslU